MRVGRAPERTSADVARICDGLLDFVVLAFAAWTVVYHVSLVLHVGALWAAIAEAAALVPCAWLAFRRGGAERTPEHPEARAERPRRVTALLAVNVLSALGAAGLFAFTGASWGPIWVLWTVAAAAAVIVSLRLPVARVATDLSDNPLRGATPCRGGQHSWLATVLALTWAVGLGVFSLFIVTSAADDAYYVHLSAWIAEHGVFPLRDTLFSDQVFPALFFPPVSSFEALVGTAGYATGLAAPDLAYFVVPPLASALSVLALWRLLRTWHVRMVGLALSVALVFLLLDASEHRALGLTVITRIWHGKVILLAVLIPLLFTLLQEYAERPTRRQLVLLAAAGTAGVGLSSTGVFLVPVVAVACLVPVALHSSRQAAAGLLATAAYPLGAGVAALAAGGRTPVTNPYVTPGKLVDDVLTSGVPAFVAVTAALAATVLIPRVVSARMTATTVLLVGWLFTPPAMLAAFHLTGLGRVLWRLTWAIPTAALVGVFAVGLATQIRSPALRMVPAALLTVALVAWGTPIWSPGGVRLAAAPSWKRPPESVTAARWILDEARPGDTILAPTAISQTIAIMSGTVTTVAPRGFYALALMDVAGGFARERVLLQRFSETGLDATTSGTARRVPEVTDVVRALGDVGVDLACVLDAEEPRRVLLAAGYSPVGSDSAVVCMRPGPPGNAGRP